MIITNIKKLTHICGFISGTQCGNWSIILWRLYIYKADLTGWKWMFLRRDYNKSLYGKAIRIHTAFGSRNCTCDKKDTPLVATA